MHPHHALRPTTRPIYKSWCYDNHIIAAHMPSEKSKSWFLRNERNLFEWSPENALKSRREHVNLSIFREGMPPTIPQQSAEL